MHRAEVKIAYIGGGSKAWARSLMQDLALDGDLAGEVALYDIDTEAAKRNQVIGAKIQEKREALSDFRYTVAMSLEEALTGADFVLISILPGTFSQMQTDVHTPEKYSILQSVGDTVGPGGVFRALRTVPVYEEFAEAVVSKRLPEGALSLVRRNSDNIDLLSEGIAERNRDKVFASFMNQPLCAGLGPAEAEELFETMWKRTETVW